MTTKRGRRWRGVPRREGQQLTESVNIIYL